MENEKISFFKRIQIAVVKIENYDKFLEEKKSISVKYFFLIVLLLAIIIGIAETYNIMKKVEKGYNYIQNDLPNFSYSDKKLKFENDYTYGYDSKYDIYFIADTSENLSKEKIDDYLKQIKSSGILLLENKVIYKFGEQKQEYLYSNFEEEMQVQNLTKNDLIDKLNEIGLQGMATVIFLTLFIVLYIIQLISVLMDWLIITIFAYVSSKICRVNMTVKQCFNISIYALTLSIILSAIYNLAFYITGFYIEYFRTIYLLISYVYVVAAILMMKSDMLKQYVEVEKIEKVQQEVHDELQDEKSEEEKDDSKDEDKENNEKKDNKNNKESDGDILTNTEPDGSEI